VLFKSAPCEFCGWTVFFVLCCSKLAHVFQCTGCETITLQPLGATHQYGEKPNQVKFTLPRGPPVGAECEHCGHGYHVRVDDILSVNVLWFV